jgi:hypothetical protein
MRVCIKHKGSPARCYEVSKAEKDFWNWLLGMSLISLVVWVMILFFKGKEAARIFSPFFCVMFIAMLSFGYWIEVTHEKIR